MNSEEKVIVGLVVLACGMAVVSYVRTKLWLKHQQWLADEAYQELRRKRGYQGDHRDNDRDRR